MCIDAQEAIQWLDDITSDSDNPSSQLVHLEGGFEVFETWPEVEKFLLPETLLSMENEHMEEQDGLTESLADLRVDAMPDNASMSSQESVGARTSSPISVYSSTSPGLHAASPFKDPKAVQPIGTGRPHHKKTGSNVSNLSTDHATNKKSQPVVPRSLQPFFNHLLWRMHQEDDTNAAMESYILVTNDQFKQQIGQRFGIRVKRLEQLRDVIAREDRDIKNREQLLKKENQAMTEETNAATANEDDDDDVVVFKRTPPTGPQAMTGKQVFDPNSFGGRVNYMSPRGNRGGFRGGRGSPVARGGHYAPRAATPPAPRAAPLDPNKPIDPESFARPAPANRVARGGRRKLWEPT